MKNPTPEQVAEAIAMKDSGATFKQVQKATGLNYSQVWLPWFRLHNADRLIDPNASDYKNVLAKARGFQRVSGGAGFKRNWSLPETSWGELSALIGLPESRIRRTFEEYTNVDSEGLRMGKGGRWLNDDQSWYMGDRPDELRRVKAGTDFIKGQAGKAEAPTMGAPAPKASAKRKPSTKADKAAKLRAKAASTTFPHEAEAFNAKAEKLEAEAS
jgi:hypothetical protein